MNQVHQIRSSSLTMSTKKVLPAKPADWDAWIFFVRARATNNRIWNSVNPDLTLKRLSLRAPTAPVYNMPDDDNRFDDTAYKAYRARKTI